jgi:hypothetical protein
VGKEIKIKNLASKKVESNVGKKGRTMVKLSLTVLNWSEGEKLFKGANEPLEEAPIPTEGPSYPYASP